MFTTDRGAAGNILKTFGKGAKATKQSVLIRKQGYYFSDGERDPYAAAVAAPVFGPDNNCLGALAISGLRDRFKPVAAKRLGKAVVGYARELSKTFGGSETAADQ